MTEDATAVPTFDEVMARYIDASEKANRYLSQLGRVEEQLTDARDLIARARKRLAEVIAVTGNANRVLGRHSAPLVNAAEIDRLLTGPEAAPETVEERSVGEPPPSVIHLDEVGGLNQQAVGTVVQEQGGRHRVWQVSEVDSVGRVRTTWWVTPGDDKPVRPSAIRLPVTVIGQVADV